MIRDGNAAIYSIGIPDPGALHKFAPSMRRQHHLSKSLLRTLAALFSGLLLSTAVLPTVMSITTGIVITAPVPVEEEQQHGREVAKSALQDHRSWDANAIRLSDRIRAEFRDHDEALPAGPISEVHVQPPKRA